jgi:hypothetical protein
MADAQQLAGQLVKVFQFPSIASQTKHDSSANTTGPLREADMGKIGRIYMRTDLGSYEQRNSAAAYRRFFQPAHPGVHDLLGTALRHKVTAGIVSGMLVLGAIGWYMTFGPVL